MWTYYVDVCPSPGGQQIATVEHIFGTNHRKHRNAREKLPRQTFSSSSLRIEVKLKVQMCENATSIIFNLTDGESKRWVVAQEHYQQSRASINTFWELEWLIGSVIISRDQPSQQNTIILEAVKSQSIAQCHSLKNETFVSPCVVPSSLLDVIEFSQKLNFVIGVASPSKIDLSSSRAIFSSARMYI